MATDGGRHPLTMKVMRVSRPSLAPAWAPFFSSSPSLSAHSTASVLSLQGSSPFSGHPKTLRDLTHAPTILTLPAAFGAIQLGESFSSCVSVNNEVNVEVHGVTLTVELQTATAKTVLGVVGGPEHVLKAGEAIDTVVTHEVKELGQHVLACSVSYILPRGFPLPGPPPVDSREDPNLQAFRKFYKFAATNPLSVKTKVHAPRSPTALFNSTERDKVFLEVHLQNLTQEVLWIEKMRLEPLEEWTVEDINYGLFDDTAALMNPEDLRQYIYVLTPSDISSADKKFPVHPVPGSIIPLGRLDISWRSSFGEPGRLLTSVLSRRIPAPPIASRGPLPPPKIMSPQPGIQQAPTAIPPYLQKAGASAAPSRPRSPHQSQAMDIRSPRSPPPQTAATASPLRRGSIASSRPQSPARGVPPRSSPTPPLPPVPNTNSRDDIELTLAVKGIPYESISLEEPFDISCTLSVSAALPILSPTALASKGRKERILQLAVQHVQPIVRPPVDPVVVMDPNVHKAIAEAMTPVRRGSAASISSIVSGASSGASTPSAASPATRGAFDYNLTQRLLVASPRTAVDTSEQIAGQYGGLSGHMRLPKPYNLLPEGTKLDAFDKVSYIGPSSIFLPPIHLPYPSQNNASMPDQRGESFCEFALSYLPLDVGFAKVGGLRILLVDDRLVEKGSAGDLIAVLEDNLSGTEEARSLVDWDAVAEVFVN